MLILKRRLFQLVWLFTFILSSIAIPGNLEKGVALSKAKRYSEAFPLIEKEARQGNAKAQFYLAKMYGLGEGTRKDLKKSVYWYGQSANQGNSHAMYNLAYLYAHGEGTGKDLKKAVELYSQAADKGLAVAQYNLALMYLKGAGINQDDEKAFEWFYKAAEQNDVNAIHAVGIAYHFGEGVPVDRGEAAKWYEKAAVQNYLPSIQNLGALYMDDGDGLSEDWDKTYYWSKKGLELGDKGISALRLGIIYFYGHGSQPPDDAKAAYYFNLAAENGRPDAWYWLGYREELSLGERINMDKAIAYYQKAADAGFKPAMKRLEQKGPEWPVRLFWLGRKLLGYD